MGKFLNTDYRDTIETIADFGKDILKNNQYYQYNDKRGIVVSNYYNQNLKNTSLDPGSLLDQDDIGPDSPHRFNYIDGLILYGFPKVELDMDNGDFGLEASPIRGECHILPNVITPYEGDFFEVPYIYDGPWLFKVTKVGRDTLENGANVFKLEFVLDRVSNEEIKDLIVDRFVYVDIQDGTNSKAIVENIKFQFAKKLDDLCSYLKEYYSDLFFNRYVQTFVCEFALDTKFYDPFLIEFMIRNEVLQNHNDDYISVDHKIILPRTFAIDYNRSLYRAFEQQSISLLENSMKSWRPELIQELASIFSTRYEDYVKTVYIAGNAQLPLGIHTVSVLTNDLLDHIFENRLYEKDEPKNYLNVIVRYFNNSDIVESDIEDFENIDYETDSIEVFYILPLLIFTLETYIKKLLN